MCAPSYAAPRIFFPCLFYVLHFQVYLVRCVHRGSRAWPFTPARASQLRVEKRTEQGFLFFSSVPHSLQPPFPLKSVRRIILAFFIFSLPPELGQIKANNLLWFLHPIFIPKPKNVCPRLDTEAACHDQMRHSQPNTTLQHTEPAFIYH